MPLPSWPKSLLPQHFTVPVASTAHRVVVAGADRDDLAESADRHRCGLVAVAPTLHRAGLNNADEVTPPDAIGTHAGQTRDATGFDDVFRVPLPS